MHSQNPINLLVVVRWPLGGIRTYMKYVYGYLSERFKITILAASTHEDDALRSDAQDIGARLVLVPAITKGGLVGEIVRELRHNRYNLIQSQGFISALQVYLANLFFRVPHVLTVHGILEDKYLQGKLARIKNWLLAWVIKHVTVLYAVSNDILEHLLEQIPALKAAGCRKAVILNGIETGVFRKEGDGRSETFRDRLGIGKDLFLLGFLGRFMPQKGFNFLIDAVEMLEAEAGTTKELHILAVGSGDYLPHYQNMAREKGVAYRFTFIPFQQDVEAIYHDVDVVVMPSIWEASGLLAMEALCSGTPLIASDCIGLRETVAGTPAIMFSSQNAVALAQAIRVARKSDLKKSFSDFAQQAQERYDVRKTALAVERLFEDVARSR